MTSTSCSVHLDMNIVWRNVACSVILLNQIVAFVIYNFSLML